MIVYAAIFQRQRCRGKKKNTSSGGGSSKALVLASYSPGGEGVRDKYDEEVSGKLGALPEVRAPGYWNRCTSCVAGI
jgi:hypothetical protein